MGCQYCRVVSSNVSISDEKLNLLQEDIAYRRIPKPAGFNLRREASSTAMYRVKAVVGPYDQFQSQTSGCTSYYTLEYLHLQAHYSSALPVLRQALLTSSRNASAISISASNGKGSGSGGQKKRGSCKQRKPSPIAHSSGEA